jgi:hypothetical protein
MRVSISSNRPILIESRLSIGQDFVAAKAMIGVGWCCRKSGARKSAPGSIPASSAGFSPSDACWSRTQTASIRRNYASRNRKQHNASTFLPRLSSRDGVNKKSSFYFHLSFFEGGTNGTGGTARKNNRLELLFKVGRVSTRWDRWDSQCVSCKCSCKCPTVPSCPTLITKRINGCNDWLSHLSRHVPPRDRKRRAKN